MIDGVEQEIDKIVDYKKEISYKSPIKELFCKENIFFFAQLLLLVFLDVFFCSKFEKISSIASTIISALFSIVYTAYVIDFITFNGTVKNIFNKNFLSNFPKSIMATIAFYFYSAIIGISLTITVIAQYIRIFGFKSDMEYSIEFLVLYNLTIAILIVLFFIPFLLMNFARNPKFKELFNFANFFRLFNNVKKDYSIAILASFLFFVLFFALLMFDIAIKNEIYGLIYTAFINFFGMVFILYLTKIFIQIHNKAKEIQEIKLDQNFINANIDVKNALIEGNCNLSNTSGFENLTTAPIEIEKWNWGGFLAPILWGVGNKVWVAFATWVPFFGFFVHFVIGVYGNKWAWQNCRWKNVEQFHQTQKKWAIFGLLFLFFQIILAAAFGLVIAYFVYQLTQKGAP